MVPRVIDLHPAEPLYGTKYKVCNLVGKQCMRLSACAPISAQAFPGADRSLNYQALQYGVVNVTERWDNKVKWRGGGVLQQQEESMY